MEELQAPEAWNLADDKRVYMLLLHNDPEVFSTPGTLVMPLSGLVTQITEVVYQNVRKRLREEQATDARRAEAPQT